MQEVIGMQGSRRVPGDASRGQDGCGRLWGWDRFPAVKLVSGLLSVPNGTAARARDTYDGTVARYLRE